MTTFCNVNGRPTIVKLDHHADLIGKSLLLTGRRVMLHNLSLIPGCFQTSMQSRWKSSARIVLAFHAGERRKEGRQEEQGKERKEKRGRYGEKAMERNGIRKGADSDDDDHKVP
eukprot:520429-Rhodomonas_salina.3